MHHCPSHNHSILTYTIGPSRLNTSSHLLIHEHNHSSYSTVFFNKSENLSMCCSLWPLPAIPVQYGHNCDEPLCGWCTTNQSLPLHMQRSNIFTLKYNLRVYRSSRKYRKIWFLILTDTFDVRNLPLPFYLYQYFPCLFYHPPTSLTHFVFFFPSTYRIPSSRTECHG